MGRLTVLALRAVLALALAGAGVVQVVLLAALIRGDLGDGQLSEGAVLAVLVLVLLGLAALQLAAVCVWRLLTMARRGTVFSLAAFRYVDVVIGAVFTASLLVLGVGVVLAPGEAVAPGAVLLVGGVALVVAGIGLIVLVMRALLAQAVALDAHAHELQTELDTVI
jgi:hypothetical protein